jgi:hypothetical protein
MNSYETALRHPDASPPEDGHVYPLTPDELAAYDAGEGGPQCDITALKAMNPHGAVETSVVDQRAADIALFVADRDAMIQELRVQGRTPERTAQIVAARLGARLARMALRHHIPALELPTLTGVASRSTRVSHIPIPPYDTRAVQMKDP